jgi:hypothetical protein
MVNVLEKLGELAIEGREPRGHAPGKTKAGELSLPGFLCVANLLRGDLSRI